jgi:lipopolysaccharide transport system ATP-binding protein
MPKPVISVEHLSKSYQLGVIGTGTVRGDFQRWWAQIRGLPDPHLKIGESDHGNRDGETLWALNDVSFQVPQGEALGIIGRNGAGKSTLLKILSRVTAPTSGVVKIKGHIASLLEVGTGFHHELTGRENIYMNGAVLGMKKAEIDRKFDEIVDFSGVEQFIDTPVKRYSSGMYVRLAFAVAAHLEPEILIVDEVLAVGDAEFQKKCLGKMSDVAHQGRTVLFVSHNMGAIKTLCTDAILLSKGKIVTMSKTDEVVSTYLGTSGHEVSEWIESTTEKKFSNPYFSPKRMCIVDANLNPIKGMVSASKSMGVLIEGEIEKLHQALTIGFAVYAPTGDLLFWAYHTDVERSKWPELRLGYNKIVGWLPPHFLNEGIYRIELMSSLHYTEWLSQPGVNAPTINFQIQGELSQSPFWMSARPGVNAPILNFETLT